MEHHAAAEHLQVIRTLMERSALYRRTLAPIMLFVGAVGTLASAVGYRLDVTRFRAFGVWWLGAAVLALAGAFFIARRQALHDGEPFWSPPTLRVAQAMVPPLAGGLILSGVLVAEGSLPFNWLFVTWNALFYGCAVHSAGFFMPRGMKLFGWILIVLGGLSLVAFVRSDPSLDERSAHLAMGALFGLLHLAYGIYLYVTDAEKRQA